MQLTGTLVQSTKVEQITESFKKCNIILEVDKDTQYPQEINIEVHNDNISKLKGLKAGDDVTVHLNLRGRRYEKAGEPTRWFNTLVMWKIEAAAQASAPAPVSKPAPSPVVAEDEDDDLPFS